MKRGGGICESALFPPLAPLPLVWPLCPLDGPHRGNLSCRACGYCAEGTSLLVTLPKVSLYSVQLSVVAAFTRRRPIYRGYYCCFHSLIGVGAVVRPCVVYRVVKED